MRRLDQVAVKGKSRAVEIFEALGFEGELGTEEEAHRALYEEALATYFRRDFQRASEQFHECLRLRPDRAAEIFIRRCEYFLAHPPPADWDGVYVFTEK